MSRPELSLFSYEILGLVGREGVSAHDLLRMAKRDRLLDWAGESQYYVEPKRLAKLGYLDALRAWARTPLAFTPVKSEPLLRLLVADLVGAEVTRESVATLRDDIAVLQGQVDEMEARAADLPHREQSLRLSARFLRRLLELHLDLVDEVERELDGPAE